MFAAKLSKVPAEASYRSYPILRVIPQFMLSYRPKQQKENLSNSVSIGITKCFAVSTRVRMVFFGIDTPPQSFCHSFIALPMMRCSKSADKSAVQVCQIATVVIETTRLVPSQFKNFLS